MREYTIQITGLGVFRRIGESSDRALKLLIRDMGYRAIVRELDTEHRCMVNLNCGVIVSSMVSLNYYILDEMTKVQIA